MAAYGEKQRRTGMLLRYETGATYIIKGMIYTCVVFCVKCAYMLVWFISIGGDKRVEHLVTEGNTAINMLIS